jgi:hypothetical protein
MCGDADGDGESDVTDQCPATPPGELVDSDGCSLAQFCARFDASTRDGARICKKADWKNDEPLMKSRERDCTVDRAAGQCIPTIP